MNKPVLIVGYGSIGRRHANVVADLLPKAPIIVLRRPESAGEAQGVKVVPSLQEALAEAPRFAILAGPAPFRLPLATELLKQDVPLLLEKPLSHSLEGVATFQELCKKRDLPVQLGYCLHFEPSLLVFKDALESGAIGKVLHIRAEVGQYLPDWRAGSDYRQDVSARKDMGGGALLELSHDVDYVLWCMGKVKEVSGRVDNISDLEMDAEDFAQIDLKFENGAVGSIHLDMVQRKPSRYCKALGAEGTLIWDYMKKSVKLFKAGDAQGKQLYQADPHAPTIYHTQLQHFLDCLENRTAPAVGVEAGMKVLEVIEAVRKSNKEGKRVVL